MFRKNILVLILNIVVLAWASLAQAYIGLCCSHCGGNMPLNLTGGGIPEPHEFRFKISEMVMEMGPLRDGTADIDYAEILGNPNNTTFPAVPRSMQQYMTMLGGAYSFSDDLALMVMTNFTQNFMQMKIASGAGGKDFTMKSSGLGDTTFLGKYRAYADDNLVPTKQVGVLFGLSIPTGSIEKKFRNNTVNSQNGTLLPFKMQLGSGTIDPIIGLTYQGSRDPFWWGINTRLEAHLYKNDQGYHRGQEFQYDFYVMKQVHDKVVVHTQLNGWWEGTYSNEPYNGRVLGEGHSPLPIGTPGNPYLSPLFDPGNYGGHKVALTLGVQYQHIPMHIIELTATLPIYQNLNGPQLRDNWMASFTYYMEVPTKKSRRYKGFSAPKELGF